MANSCVPYIFGFNPWDKNSTPARTPGTLGVFDAGDPNHALASQGDTPGSLGVNDHASPENKKTPHSVDPNATMVASDNATLFVASFEAMGFICPDGKIRAYQDGGCGKGNWTIGVGEYSGRDENSIFNSEVEAFDSFKSRIKNEYSKRVRDNLKTMNVKRKLLRYEFDALVDLTYNHGNCLSIAGKIAKEKKLHASDFMSVTPGELADRRSSEYDLYCGNILTISGYKRYLRLDNTSGGYCNIGKLRGYKVENSNKSYTLDYLYCG